MDNLDNIVRRAVHIDWDPIGVVEFAKEMGEYDSYVPGICDLLRRNASKDEVFEYLWIVETESIGLPGDRERTKRFAERLCELSDNDRRGRSIC